MADDVVLNSGSGGDTIAADDILGVKYQRVKLVLGANNTNDGDVASANPLPVTGTVAVTNADITTIAGAVAGTEMQVDVVTSALPSGAATAAKQPALGTAGTASTDVISVQGIASMTPIQVGDNSSSLTVDNAALSVTGGGVEATALRVTIASDSTGVLSIDDNGGAITVDGTVAVTNGGTFATQVDGAALTALQLIDDPVATLGTTTYTETSTKGMIVGAVRRDADTTLVDTTNEVGPLQMDANGRLKVEAFSGETLPVSLASVPSHAVTNAGTFAVQESSTAASRGIYVEDAAETAGGNLVMAGAVRRDTAASSSGTTGDNSTINVDALGKLWTTGSYAEDAAHTAGDTLTAIAARRIDTPAASSGTSGDYSTVDVSAEGALWTTTTPTTTGGCSIFRSLDIDETEEDVKTSAGNLYGYFFGNVATSVRYLKFYNATAASVSVGTTTPVLTFPLPASSSGHVGFSFPVGFSTAICVACTTGVADADTGAPAANDVIINCFYK